MLGKYFYFFSDNKILRSIWSKTFTIYEIEYRVQLNTGLNFLDSRLRRWLLHAIQILKISCWEPAFDTKRDQRRPSTARIALL